MNTFPPLPAGKIAPVWGVLLAALITLLWGFVRPWNDPDMPPSTLTQVMTDNLVCLSNVNITLEANCQREITASMVLTGSFGDLTDDDFEIAVLDGAPSNGPLIDGCGEFSYEIRLRPGVEGSNFTECWGTVRLEDKTNPQVVCPPNTNTATLARQAQFINGALSATDPVFAPAGNDCHTGGAAPPGNPTTQHYDLYSFFVTAPAIYTFLMTDTFAGDASGALALYQGPFMPGNPCENLIYSSDSTFTPNVALSTMPSNGHTHVFEPSVRIALALKPGVSYTLLVSSASEITALGAYGIAVYSSATGRLIGPGLIPPQAVTLTALLLCEDIHQVFLNAPQSYFTDRHGNITGISASLNRILGYTGFPDVSDNCGPLKVTVSDAVQFNGNCGDAIITRTFRVEDKQNSACGGVPNASECTQTITIRKPAIQDVTLPPIVAFLGCQDAFPTLPGGDPSPGATGFPFVAAAFGNYNLNPTWCNLAAQYLDAPRAEVCPGFYKFLRSWTILDWCNPANSRLHNQLVAVGNYLAPKVTCPVLPDPWGAPLNGLMYSTTPYDCTASFEAPVPLVNAPCAGGWNIHTEIVTDVQVPLLDSTGQQIGTTPQTAILRTILPGASRFVTGIPIGEHRFRYIVTDDCGNSSVEECAFQVVDISEPGAVCNDQLHISLNGQGTARLLATEADEGSNDNCGLASIAVRRRIDTHPNCAPAAASFSDWGNFVDFNCCDAGRSARVELRVTDLQGNENICWLDIPVEDKIRPFCHAPQDTSVHCNELPADFDPTNLAQLRALFGQPTASDNCYAAAEEIAPIVNLHPCGWGTIIRRFRAVDNSGNISANLCQQIIAVNEVHNYEIMFPRDAEANCGIPLIDTIQVFEMACDLLAVSVQDEVLHAAERGCFKIMRTYRVINWCEYDGQSPPVVVSRDEDCDGNPGDEHVWVLVRPNGVTYYDRDNDETNSIPAAFSKPAACDGLTNPAGYWMNSVQNPAIASRGFWEYTQQIKVFDDFSPSIFFSAVQPFCSYENPAADDPLCRSAVVFPFTVEEKCTPNDVSIRVFLDLFNDDDFLPFDFNVLRNPDSTMTGDTDVFAISGRHPSYAIVTNNGQGLPIGQHRFVIDAVDGCGNTRRATAIIEIIDCLEPTPICHNGLTATLMPADTDNDGFTDGGMATVWASDFIASPVMDCTMPVTYSIRRAGQSPDSTRSSLHFSCADYNPADGATGTLQIVYIDAWDGAGNRGFCETYVRVQDQSGACTGPATAAIAGIIQTEQHQPVEGVQVALSGPVSDHTETQAAGLYSFGSLLSGGDFTITPLLDRDYLNGVTTFDLVLIQRHILAVQLLDSPYKMIAADANNSRSITTADVILLRRLILALVDELPGNTSWRFIPASYVFPLPANPWFEPFPELINLNDLTGDLAGLDFIGVKTGDVNGSATNSLNAVEERHVQGVFVLAADDRTFHAGDRVEVSFRGKDMERLLGFQLTLGFDHAALAIEGIEYGTAGEGSLGLRFTHRGLITMSWNEQGTGVPAKSGEAFFTLVFRAQAAGRLSEALKVSNNPTRAEAYDLANRTLSVILEFGNHGGTQDFDLYQNQPNPFNASALIAFRLPEAGEATLTITDVQGMVISVIRGYYAAGLYHVPIRADALPAGVLQYTLSSGEFTATRRMVVTR